MMEDLKEWYYKLTNIIKADQGIEEPAYIFDAEHEKKRKEQLELLWNRTTDEVLFSELDFHDSRFQIKEEDSLKNQMKRLEAKRKDREKRAQDLQRLINTSERSSAEPEA
jgi:DNA methyltransferase 1-associated protein 1